MFVNFCVFCMVFVAILVNFSFFSLVIVSLFVVVITSNFVRVTRRRLDGCCSFFVLMAV